MPRYDFEGRWECTSGGSNKFYEIEQLDDDTFECTYGAIGSGGNSIEKTYSEVMKKVREFSGKGYRQVSGRGASTSRRVRPQVAPVDSAPAYSKNRLEAIEDEEETIKPKTEVKKEPTGRLASID